MTLTGSTISGNATPDSGGGIYNAEGTKLEIVNSTFSNNLGSGLVSHGDSLPIVTNCILWNNRPHQIGDDPGFPPDPPIVKYSDVQGGWSGPGANNIDADPLFVDPNGADDVPGTLDDNVRLMPGSPCFDAGDNLALPLDSSDLDDDGVTTEPIPVDLDGQPRFVDDSGTPDTGNPDGINPLVDMGAYEFGPPDLCADDDGDGLVTICHIPPGNPDNARTITVGVNAVRAHLAHGDHCGPCEEDDGLLLGDSSDEDQHECSTDLDDSGGVGAADLAELLGAWGPNPGHPADLDGDGNVGPLDLALVLGNWGPCP